jgi:hypothetical protein
MPKVKIREALPGGGTSTLSSVILREIVKLFLDLSTGKT